MVTLLADIGGTHARFAALEDGAAQKPEKRCVQDYRSLEDALSSYCEDAGHRPQGQLLIATAARNHGTIWRFQNNNQWEIDRAALATKGWTVPVIINDFEASAYGALSLDEATLETIRPGTPAENTPRIVLGPGTGLGLAYAVPASGRWHVQQTYGGHMAASAVNDEQALFLHLVRRVRGGDHETIPENLISGPGLVNLYKAACLYAGAEGICHSAEDVLAHKDDRAAVIALRLFHEFLGMFVHNTVITLNGFGGVYFDGGTIQRIQDAGLFDKQSFEKYLVPELVPVVKASLAQLPVWLIDDPYIALRGLQKVYEHGA